MCIHKSGMINMIANLSQKQIGQRIASIRRLKKLSQEELARRVGISRSSLTQIELGNRNVDIIEMKRLSMILGFSLDDIMSRDFRVDPEIKIKIKDRRKKTQERISVPRLQVNKFINVFLYILERCAGKPNIGETALYKLLYFCDFNYYELYEEHLTGAKYRKLPFGPVPQKLNAILDDLIAKNQLQKIKTEFHGYPQTRYLPLVKADLTVLKASEKEVIDRVIDQMSDWSAAMISDYSHNDRPWKATENKDVIDYELAFYRLPPFSVRVYEEDEQDRD